MIKKSFLPLVIIILSCFMNACTDPDIIGLQVQPKGEQLGVDTAFTSLNTYTVREDSLPATNNSYNLFGSYTDPIFGNTNASFYAQMRMASNVIVYTTPIVDSAVIVLAYRGSYGKTTAPQTIKVYRMTEAPAAATTTPYYSDKTFAYDNQAIANYTFVPKPHDTLVVGNTKLAPQLRIPISKDFITSLFKDTIHTATQLNKVLKGLYFRPEKVSGEGAILYFDLLAADSKMVFYYHDKINGVDSSLSASLNFGGDALRIGHFEHDYSGTNILSTSAQSQTYSYVQAMAGVRTKIVLPDMTGLKSKGNILINKAVLSITVETADTANYGVPSKLFVLKKDAKGTMAPITDQFEGTNYYGGGYDLSKTQYKFNVARHIQEFLNRTVTDPNLYLSAGTAAITGNRVVIGGGRNTNDKLKMKLHITYTKIN